MHGHVLAQGGRTTLRRQDIDHRIAVSQQPGGDTIGYRNGREQLGHRSKAESSVRFDRDARCPIRQSVASLEHAGARAAWARKSEPAYAGDLTERAQWACRSGGGHLR